MSKNDTTAEANLTEQEFRAAVLGRARSKATSALIEKYRPEFNSLVAGFAAEEGVEWAPRPTKEEKAAEALAALLEEFPGLRDKVG